MMNLLWQIMLSAFLVFMLSTTTNASEFVTTVIKNPEKEIREKIDKLGSPQEARIRALRERLLQSRAELREVEQELKIYPLPRPVSVKELLLRYPSDEFIVLNNPKLPLGVKVALMLRVEKMKAIANEKYEKCDTELKIQEHWRKMRYGAVVAVRYWLKTHDTVKQLTLKNETQVQRQFWNWRWMKCELELELTLLDGTPSVPQSARNILTEKVKLENEKAEKELTEYMRVR